MAHAQAKAADGMASGCRGDAGKHTVSAIAPQYERYDLKGCYWKERKP